MQLELPVRNDYAPVRTLMLYVTRDCNLRCTYCFVNKTPIHMPSEIARSAVDFLLHRNISGSVADLNINFFGGEPFLKTDLLEELVAYARLPRPNCYKRVHFSATTNATFANARVERLIREARMDLMISLDGASEATSSRPFVSGRSSYQHVMKNVPKLLGWANRAMIRMTFHPAALDLLQNVQAAMELGATSIALCPVVESDWSGCEQKLQDAYAELGEWFVQELHSGRIPPLERTWDILRRLAWADVRSRKGSGCDGCRPERPCDIGTGLIAVDVDGHVLPCHRMLEMSERRLGHVSQPVLAPARSAYVQLSSKQFEECKGCLAEPVCGGGCRVVALSAGYALHQPHPSHCLLTRAHTRAAYQIFRQVSLDPWFRQLVFGSTRQVANLSQLASTGG